MSHFARSPTGRVLSVTRGKGANALRQFAWRLRRYKGKIRYVCIDMSQAYSAWVAENLPKAKVVFDHFRLIKAMVEKMDHVRRREMAKLDCEAKRTIKGHRLVFMRNEENLDAKGQRILGYWDFGHANSGSAEGFNTKVRLLMKQSYGLRDFKYLKLKIMDLPSRKIRVSI